MQYEYKNGNIVIKNDTTFNVKNTLDCGQVFRINEEKNGDFKIIMLDQILFISQDENEIILKNIDEEKFDKYWKNYFDFDTDYAKYCEILSQDECLKKAINEFSGIRILRQNTWETLCSFIISQNNNIPRIKKIIASFCENFGEKIDDENYSFPTVETVAKLTLEEISIIKAGFRGKYILDAATKVFSGEINLEKISLMSLEDASEELMKIKGVGPKVAQCVLLFGFYQINAFPIDVWVKKIMSELYPNGLPKCTENIQGIAQQFLFHWRRNSEEFKNISENKK